MYIYLDEDICFSERNLLEFLNDNSAGVCKIPTGKVELLQKSGSIAFCQLFRSEFCRRPQNSSMNSTIVRKSIEKYFISYRHVWIEFSRFVHYQGMKLQHPKVCL